jgi:aryl-alcohol dehydrogenase-like predicted oxidoreductase
MFEGQYSRRELMRRGLLAAGATAFAGQSWTGNELSLTTKPIPSTGERLPVIGLGTIWYRDAQYEALKAVLKRMHELGGTLIDTAAAYGESEAVIGRALHELGTRRAMFLATKFDAGGPLPMPASPPGPGNALPGPPAGITRPARDGVGGQQSFERSLQRLQTGRIDLLQVHGMNGTDALMPLLLQWKKDKKIRYIGVTTSSSQQHGEVIEAMRKYPLDFVQVDYSLGNREAASSVLPVALERRVAVLANLPLGRAALLQQLSGRPLPPWAADIDVGSWSQFLLKYVVSHPAVTCAIPGSTKVEHLEDNQRAGRGRLPDEAMRQKMEQLWDGVGK